MGFTSINDYLNLVTNSGQIASTSWQKMLGANGVFTAGRWYNMGYFEGYPMLSRPGERIPSGYGQLMGAATGWTGVSGFWSYLNNTLVCAAGGTSAVSLTPANLTAGVKYGLEYTITGYSAGTLTPSLGGTNFTGRTANGTFFEEIVTINNSSGLAFTPGATFAGAISNISLVQIGCGVPLFDTDMGALYTSGAVTPNTKHVVFSGVVSNAANFVPGTWKLVDMLMAYPVDMNTANTTSIAAAVSGNTNCLFPIGENYSAPFQNGGGAWTYGSGWAYNSANSVTATTPSGTLSLPVANFMTATGVGSANAPIVGYVYNITFTISNFSGSGTMTAGIGGGTSTKLTLANGTYTLQATAINTSGALIFTIASGSPSFTLSMVPDWITPAFTNSSGSPWTYGTNWAYTNATTATITAAGSQGTLSLTVAQMTAGNVPVIGQTYNITYVISVSAWTSMTISASIGGVTSAAITIAATGTYLITQQVTAVNATGALIFTTTGTHTATLYGVNVMTGNAQMPFPAFQNGGGAWTYGAGIAYTSGTSVTETNSTAALTLPLAQMNTGFTPISGQTYNIIYTLTLNSGSGTVTVGYGGSTSATVTLATGTFNTILTAVNNTGPLIFTFAAGTSSCVLSNLTISSISNAAAGVAGVYVGLPRYSNGEKVKAMLCWHSGAWNAAGNIASSAAHNIQINYTNEINDTNQYTPFPVAGVASAPIMGHIDNSGVAANNFGPFLPLMTGIGMEASDGGIKSVQNLNLSASVLASAGANPFCELILCKELLTIPNVTVYVPTERDYMNQIKSLPQIQDGANLQWLFTPGAATAVNTSAYGWIDYAWGT